jgi:hypothetical protein
MQLLVCRVDLAKRPVVGVFLNGRCPPEEVKSWQNRPKDAVYPIVYLDALVVKIREVRRLLKRQVSL